MVSIEIKSPLKSMFIIILKIKVLSLFCWHMEHLVILIELMSHFLE